MTHTLAPLHLLLGRMSYELSPRIDRKPHRRSHHGHGRDPRPFRRSLRPRWAIHGCLGRCLVRIQTQKTQIVRDEASEELEIQPWLLKSG